MFLILLPYIVVALIAMMVWYALRRSPRSNSGTFVGRFRTRDISFLAQSPTALIGRITRSVPLPRITPDPNDVINPVTYFGLACLNTALNTVRQILATDSGVIGISGIVVQPFPFQPSSGTNFGAQALTALVAVPSGMLLDVLRTGFMGVYLNSAQAPTATKADKVYVWCAASTGTHVQGGFENAPSGSAVSAPKVGGNTGNGTVSAGPVVDATKALGGVYTINFTAATMFEVLDPNGNQLADGATGVAYSQAGIGFTITAGGTAFVAGDGFTITTTMETIPVPNAYFNGPGDATGAVELAFNL